ANISTAGKVPEADPSASPSTVYKPLTTQLLPQEGGGVQGIVSEQNNPYSIIYDPNSIFANEDGNIAVPNVDLTTELVSLKTIEIAYKANIASIKTQDEVYDTLLD